MPGRKSFPVTLSSRDEMPVCITSSTNICKEAALLLITLARRASSMSGLIDGLPVTTIRDASEHSGISVPR